MVDDLRVSEYGALRATIRERGTLRVCLVLAGLIAWAALLMPLALLDYDRAATLVPFTILAVTFETSFFIHTGVERVGRYLQVFYEDANDAGPASWGWENIVMAYGKKFPGGGLDPLFGGSFALAAAVNFAASFIPAARHPGWVLVSLLAHAIFIWRLMRARKLAGAQRELDLERFRAIRNASPSN